MNNPNILTLPPSINDLANLEDAWLLPFTSLPDFTKVKGGH